MLSHEFLEVAQQLANGRSAVNLGCYSTSNGDYIRLKYAFGGVKMNGDDFSVDAKVRINMTVEAEDSVDQAIFFYDEDFRLRGCFVEEATPSVNHVSKFSYVDSGEGFICTSLPDERLGETLDEDAAGLVDCHLAQFASYLNDMPGNKTLRELKPEG